ncbi:right-handed parallel beta-helix repeat-containing protein [Xanthomonas floridensis]|uniref:Right-handed parallel beta-helix repeat-containing protein n=1 Tax=Xanthomonas floridensis TaxID=1843580 RepID=A0A1A9M832_9XANT|nr:right-handed parallel beta-helix repeat-containing protein [Xanthomonas floridensis]MEA5122761.1 right-handed parallel beta-helix repeat-containing protein [Xanthomonas floridensis]MEA5131198.1 right-handed parallel beta-helix repeat-containing protein [Xanthomonas floridensis]OAG66282.1 hypothetical protein A7D17_04970 [Xanthomonas floridensis]
MRLQPRTLLILILALTLPMLHADAASVAGIRLYLAPDGDDAAAGTAPSSALRSLAAAQHRLIEQAPPGTVDVVIAAGTYVGQSVQWTFVNRAPIRFIAAPGAATPPVFDGQGAGTWFALRGGRNAETRLSFEGLTVRNYWMALYLGSSNADEDGNAGNTVRHMRFERIGGLYGHSSEAAYGFAAIRLQHSRDNRIEHNRFASIENDKTTSGFVHALYLARQSSGNRVQGNTFIDISGDAVRTRDASDDTYVGENRFLRAGKYAAFSDWIKPGRECPSQGGRFIGNTVGTGYYGPIAATRTTGADTVCGPLQRPRIQERGTLAPD